MKKYDIKTGRFDLVKNKNKKKSLPLRSFNSDIFSNKTQENFFSPKKNLQNQISVSTDKKMKLQKKNKSLTVSLNSIDNKNKTINTTDSFRKSSSLTKIPKNYFHSFNNNKNYHTQNLISTEEMVNFLLETDFDKKTIFKDKNNISCRPIQNKNYRKSNQLKQNLFNCLNDPLNPYSTNFYNNLLQTNYKVGIHFKELEQGVPALRTIKISKDPLPLINNMKLKKNNLPNKTYSEGFFKKKSYSEIKRKRSGTPEKKIDNNVLFKNYGEPSDYTNKNFDIPINEESKVEQKFKKDNLSEVIEETI